MSIDAYDDDAVLRDYLIHNHVGLMTPDERRSYFLAIKREKATVSDTAASRLQKWLAEETEEIRQASLGGLPAVEVRITSRILRDVESGALTVNRCPKCNRIVRTSKAQQCLWCGHDWHPCS